MKKLLFLSLGLLSFQTIIQADSTHIPTQANISLPTLLVAGGITSCILGAYLGYRLVWAASIVTIKEENERKKMQLQMQVSEDDPKQALSARGIKNPDYLGDFKMAQYDVNRREEALLYQQAVREAWEKAIQPTQDQEEYAHFLGLICGAFCSAIILTTLTELALTAGYYAGQSSNQI